MARYDKYDPKVGGFRAPLAANWATADLEKIVGVGLNTSGQVVKGPGNTGIIGVIVLTKAWSAGTIVDVMTSGEIVEFGPTFGTPGTDFGTAGTAYYAQTTAVNEVQTITITGTPDGGDFTLTFTDGGVTDTTAAIAYNAAAADVDAALALLDNIGDAANITCGGGALPGAAVTVTFTGALAGRDVSLLVPDGSGLTGGTNPAITVAHTTPGHAATGDVSVDATTGAVYVGHTVEAKRLVVRVRPGAAA